MAQETGVMQVSEPKLLFCQIFTQTPWYRDQVSAVDYMYVFCHILWTEFFFSEKGMQPLNPHISWQV